MFSIIFIEYCKQKLKKKWKILWNFYIVLKCTENSWTIVKKKKKKLFFKFEFLDKILF